MTLKFTPAQLATKDVTEAAIGTLGFLVTSRSGVLRLVLMIAPVRVEANSQHKYFVELDGEDAFEIRQLQNVQPRTSWLLEVPGTWRFAFETPIRKGTTGNAAGSIHVSSKGAYLGAVITDRFDDAEQFHVSLTDFEYEWGQPDGASILENWKLVIDNSGEEVVLASGPQRLP